MYVPCYSLALSWTLLMFSLLHFIIVVSVVSVVAVVACRYFGVLVVALTKGILIWGKLIRQPSHV